MTRPTATEEYIAKLEDDLLAIADAVRPRGPDEDVVDHAMSVSAIRRMFETDEEFYINLAAKVRGRNNAAV